MLNRGTVLANVQKFEMKTVAAEKENKLNKDDIPGAKLPKPAECCTVAVLKRQLLSTTPNPKGRGRAWHESRA